MFNGWTVKTEFEIKCEELSLSPSQVAVALSFGRDMIAEAEAKREDACVDNGFRGSCGCTGCLGQVEISDDPLPF